MGIRSKLVELIPRSVMLATSAGIGLFLAHIGMQVGAGACWCVSAGLGWAGVGWKTAGGNMACSRLRCPPTHRPPALHRCAAPAPARTCCVQSGEGLAITTYNSATLVTLGGCAPQYRTYQFTVKETDIFVGSPPPICSVDPDTGAVSANGGMFVPSGEGRRHERCLAGWVCSACVQCVQLLLAMLAIVAGPGG